MNVRYNKITQPQKRLYTNADDRLNHKNLESSLHWIQVFLNFFLVFYFTLKKKQLHKKIVHKFYAQINKLLKMDTITIFLVKIENMIDLEIGQN